MCAIYVTTLLKVSLKSTLETQGLTSKQWEGKPWQNPPAEGWEEEICQEGGTERREEDTYITHAHAACICNGYAEATNLTVTGSQRMEVSVQLQSQWQNKERKGRVVPVVFGRLRMFVRSTSWWKKEGAVTLTRLLPHAGFTDGKVLGLVWVSLWLLTFGVKSVKTLSFQLKFSWAPLHIPITVTGMHWKREKDILAISG